MIDTKEAGDSLQPPRDQRVPDEGKEKTGSIFLKDSDEKPKPEKPSKGTLFLKK